MKRSTGSLEYIFNYFHARLEPESFKMTIKFPFMNLISLVTVRGRIDQQSISLSRIVKSGNEKTIL
jgi:hypothetical protein